ncbi:DUF4293 domain-containing protein [Fibrella sp. HMF5335]|uniref:DUF4293 domain-containing protein n=1 Tax=Fibrella rubiginis TaxID=2817060 RepID=A0A939GHE2_9BACT|nr:DUF4293 domain-containing protein [Fibrella rubiginis]MBO0937828.1 DUF4293 domain-containing protein [Fibrella rubiginis]
MIQRIQSVFLFLISASMGTALVNPIWEKNGVKPGEEAELTPLQYSYEQGITTFTTPTWYLAGLLVLVAIVALVAIFQYRKRILQMGLCAVNAILLTASMGVVLYNVLVNGKTYGNPNDQGSFLAGFWAILAALVFNFLANRFIRRDEKLVRESNRIR